MIVKKKQAPKKMTATTTRNILAFALVVITLGAIAGFYFGLEMVRSYAVEVSHAVTDSTASGKSIDQLSTLKKQLADSQTLVSKADSLFSTADTYQTQALKDISKYAAESGVTITGIESAQTDAITSTSAGTGATSTSPATGTGAANTTAAGYSEVITLQSPVSYAKFLQFLDAIEGNLPKMQITGISVSRPANATGDLITTDKITITVSVR